MATSNPIGRRQRWSDAMQLSWQVADDIIIAAAELDLLMRSFGVTGNNHVITLVRDRETNRAYFGFSYRLRKHLGLPEYRNILDMRVAWFFDPTTIDEERRVMPREPSSCAEHDAYSKFYLDRPGARPQDSYAVSVKYNCSGGYVAVKRCRNCLSYSEVMGDVPTDSIDGHRIPLQASPHDIDHLAQIIMQADLGDPSPDVNR